MRGQRDVLVDVGLAAALVLAAELEAVFEAHSVPRFVDGLVVLGFTVPLAWRRRVPLAVVAACVASVLVYGQVERAGAHQTLVFALALAMFTAGYDVPQRRSLIAPGIVVAALLGSVAVHQLGGDLPFALVLYVGPWLFGALLRARGERLATLEEGIDARASAAAAAERTRIARELHDVVSHSISVITVQTQAIRRRLGPEHAREIEELRAVETTARQAMAEMRRLLGVLRAGDERLPLAPQPGLEQLPRLAEQTAGAGLPVDVRVIGDATTLPPGVDLTAFRIVQEALTNALRHARARRAAVTLDYREDALAVEVRDDGRGGGAVNRSGHGLIGMRERVALYGGSFAAGPTPDGFVVTAELPLQEGSA